MVQRAFDFRWQDEKNLYFDMIIDGRRQKQTVAFGLPLSIKVMGGIGCTGFERDGEWHTCPTNTVGTRCCPDCKTHAGYPAVQYCDGYNLDMFTADELEALNKPHYLYLTIFADNLLKVGVSSSSRNYLRQIEQGSLASLIVAKEMWGVPARQMETTIRKSGVNDKIQSTQKQNSIFPEISMAQAKEQLEALASKALPLLSSTKPEWQKFVLPEPEFLHFDEYYHLAQAQALGRTPQIVNLSEQEGVSGRLVAVKGSFLLIDTDTELIAINAKKLRGYELSFAAQPTGLHTQGGWQGTLF